MLFKNFNTKMKFSHIKYNNKYFHIEKTLQENFKPIIEDLDVYIANDGEMWFSLEDMTNYLGLDFYTIFENILPEMKCQDSNGKFYISEFGVYRIVTLMDPPKKVKDPFIEIMKSFGINSIPEVIVEVAKDHHNKHKKCQCNECKKKVNEKNNSKSDLFKVPVDIKDLVNLSELLGNMIDLQKEMLETIEKMQKTMEKIKIKK